MKYNNELCVINTQEKAYLLGFLYGDGCICIIKNKEKPNNFRYTTKISISKNDEELINELYIAFPFFNLGKFDYSIYNTNMVKQVSISKSSKELYNDLLLNGVYPRKSYENKDKLKMPNIDNNLISHFIRGFFDADGSVYVRSKRKNLITIEFCSVAKEFIYGLDLYLKSINITSWQIREKRPSKGKQIIYTLTYIKTNEIIKLIKYMYNDANISLKRKKDKCLNYKPVDKVKERGLICTACNSPNVWKNGIRNNSIRFKCHDCGQGFSIKNKII